jgi:hypothetical protein
VGFMVDKVTLGQVFSEYFGFPAHSKSTDCSILIIYHPRLVQVLILIISEHVCCVVSKVRIKVDRC